MVGTTIWSVGSAEADRFAPSTSSFMANYRVEDARALAQVLKEAGCNVLDKIDKSEYGVVAWAIDAEGNKVELWRPPVGQWPRTPARVKLRSNPLVERTHMPICAAHLRHARTAKVDTVAPVAPFRSR